SLPESFRIFKNLAQLSPIITITQPQGMPSNLSPTNVLTHLLFFAAFAFLHYKNIQPTPTSNLQMQFNPQELAVFRMSPSQPFHLAPMLLSSTQVCVFAYRAQCSLLRYIYGNGNGDWAGVPSPSSTPPKVLCGSPMVFCLLVPAPTVVLEHAVFGAQLAGMGSVVSGGDGSSGGLAGQGLDPLASLTLPVLDNLAQIWPTASTYSANLRTRIKILREKCK
ncbi:hypothetical protein HDV05_000054, partial [Chytridiales sp. JEL 0842]